MFKLKKRCIRCLHILRDDGTCQNPDCVRYTESKDTEADMDKAEKDKVEKDKAEKDGR